MIGWKTASTAFTILISCGAVGAPAPRPMPNILFIITDQQFADAMSCRMGPQFIHTPTMDRLARAGTLFTRAYSTNPLCMPWRNSAFTGRYSHETGATQNADPPGGLDPMSPATAGRAAAPAYGTCALMMPRVPSANCAQ